MLEGYKPVVAGSSGESGYDSGKGCIGPQGGSTHFAERRTPLRGEERLGRPQRHGWIGREGRVRPQCRVLLRFALVPSGDVTAAGAILCARMPHVGSP